MVLATSRRSLLFGALGLSAAAAGRSGQRPPSDIERIGAFPIMPGGRELLGPQPGIARLNNNENPYGPAASALRMVEYAAGKSAYYSGRAERVLSRLIADRHGLDPENVVVSTGSAEALSAIALIYGQKGPILVPRLCFDATPLYAQRLGLAKIVRAPMKQDLSIDLETLESMVTNETGMVELCNPNNPTGTLSDPVLLKAAVKRMASQTTVVIDEAYMELTDDPARSTCIGLVKDGYDVIVTRTFSKIYGMAGLRVGYTISSAETAAKIRSAKMSWMSGVGIAAAVGCYDDTAFVAQSLSRIIEGREMILDTLKNLELPYLPSQTNFIYFKTEIGANAVQSAFKDQGILIRGQYMDYKAWSRVSTGRLEDVERFCTSLPEILNA